MQKADAAHATLRGMGLTLALTNDLHANGGAMSLMAHRYVAALNDAGHHCTLITGEAGAPLPTDIPVISWKYPERGAGVFGSFRLAREIKRRSGEAFAEWMRVCRAEGRQPEGWLAMVIPSAYGSLSRGGADLSLLYICNSPWAMEWDAAYESAHGRRAGAFKRLLALWPRRRMEAAVVRRARGWTALSQLQLDWFTSEHPATAHIHKRVIAGAVEVREFAALNRADREGVKRRESVPAGMPMMVCSRRLVPRTGVDLLIQAHGQMKRDAMLLITGDGPERERLHAIAEASPKASLVRLLGFVDRDRLSSLTSAADLAVVPTRALEGFGLSVAEAFASGTPVVATPVTALLHVVGDLDRRLLASEVGAQSLARALDRALSDPELASEEFRRECREYAMRYDWQSLKQTFVAYVEEIVGGSAKPRVQ